MERVHHHDPEQTVLGHPVTRVQRIHPAQSGQHSVKRTLRSEDALDADGAHEGRQDHRHEQREREEAAAREAIAVIEQREG